MLVITKSLVQTRMYKKSLEVIDEISNTQLGTDDRVHMGFLMSSL